MFSTQTILSALVLLAPLASAAPAAVPDSSVAKGPANLKFMYCHYDTHPYVPGLESCEILAVYTNPATNQQEIVKTSRSHTSATCGAMKLYRSHENTHDFEVNLDMDRRIDIEFNGKEIKTGTPDIISRETSLLQKFCPKISGQDGGKLTSDSFVYVYSHVENIFPAAAAAAA